jgi:hypothetical protein
VITLEFSCEPDSKWNQRLLDSKLGSMQQTKEYGYSKSKVGASPLFLKFITSNGEIVGQLLILLYSKLENKGKIGRILQKFVNDKFILAKWVYGPIIFNENYKDEINLVLQNFLIQKKYKIWGSEFPLQSIFSNNVTPFTLKQWGTFLIDLSLNKEDIWKKLDKHSAKKNVKRSQERNVEIREMTKSDLQIYYNLYKNSAKKNSNVGISFLEEQWNILHPIGYSGFIAFENNIPIGAIRVSSFNGYINEYSIIRSERDTKEKLYSQDLLKWKIIEWGLENNFSYYDLSGINLNPNNIKEKGIFRYKQKWGGKLTKYNIIK